MVNLDVVRNIKEHLAVTMNGTVKGTMQNYMTVLKEDPVLAGSLRFNLLNQRVDVVKILWWNKRITSLTDEGEEFLFYYFERYYDLGNEKNMKKALRAEANSNKYHPICDYLNALQWDGTERIRHVLKRYMGADDTDLVYECLKHFMIGAILRVFHLGYKMDEMLCLVGTQGAGKSTFFRFLAVKDDWFSDDLKHLNDEKVYGKLRGHTATLGIRRAFNIQKAKYFPMPDYNVSSGTQVEVTVYGKTLNDNYMHILYDYPDLDLHTVFLLDRVRKGLTLQKEDVDKLRSLKLVEGRITSLYLSASASKSISDGAGYIKKKGFDDKYYKDLIVEYLKQYERAKKNEICELLWDKLPDALSDKQKENKIHNLLTSLKKNGVIDKDSPNQQKSN